MTSSFPSINPLLKSLEVVAYDKPLKTLKPQQSLPTGTVSAKVDTDLDYYKPLSTSLAEIRLANAACGLLEVRGVLAPSKACQY